MKKVLSITLSLMMLCLGIVAFADAAVPSKTTNDLTSVTVTSAENENADISNLVIRPASPETEPEKVEYAEKALETAQAAESLETYLGEETVAAVKAVVGEDATLSMDEFFALFVSGYEEEMGKVTAEVQVATPYEEGEKVAVLVSNEGETFAWTTLEGVGTAEGGLSVTFDAETLLNAQNGNAIFATVSAE